MTTQNKINAIASAFGAHHSEKTKKPCRGKYAGTVDYSISFDNGERLYVCNSGAGRGAFDRCVDELYELYNPDAVAETKAIALKKLRERSVLDNAIAAQMGLLPHDVLSVEMNTTDRNGYMGWFYVVLMVGGNIINHVDTGTYYDIRRRKLSDGVRKTYFTAGGLRDGEADYVFNGIGFSSKSPIYKLNKAAVFYNMV